MTIRITLWAEWYFFQFTWAYHRISELISDVLRTFQIQDYSSTLLRIFFFKSKFDIIDARARKTGATLKRRIIFSLPYSLGQLDPKKRSSHPFCRIINIHIRWEIPGKSSLIILISIMHVSSNLTQFLISFWLPDIRNCEIRKIALKFRFLFRRIFTTHRWFSPDRSFLGKRIPRLHHIATANGRPLTFA